MKRGLDTVPNYLSTGYIILLIAALVLVAAGLVLLFWKGPRSSCPLRTRILTGIGAMAVSGALMGGGCALAFFTGNLSDQFANLAFAYEDYGFSYCFLQTWLNRGSAARPITARRRWRILSGRWRRRRRRSPPIRRRM